MFTIVELINNIYTIIKNSEKTIKTKKVKLLRLLITYFTNQKYYINRSSLNNNRFILLNYN